MLLQDQALATLRGQLIDIISGTVFVFLGLTALGIAAMRRRSGVRILMWVALWSLIYGAMRMLEPLGSLAHLPHWFQAGAFALNALNMYLILVVATCAWVELTIGKMRVFLWVIIFAALAIGVPGVAYFLFTGDRDKFMPYNNLLAVCSLTVLVVVVAVPRLAHRFLVTPNSKVLLIGTLVFAVEALVTNFWGSLGHHFWTLVDSAGFAIFLLSFAYVALQIVFGNERRLLAIENELAIARDIQRAILPSASPEIDGLAIACVYQPMTEVAGDFYDFTRVDGKRVGVLVADVSGHGVPAALIASMIKVAMQSVAACADDPSQVLRGLNRILLRQLHEQFVTAAYLFVDMQEHRAKYSAAGHPPLLLLRNGKLERVESNGLVLGIATEPDYPVYEMPVLGGDRLLLYTDGMIEPENAQGRAFGETRLEEVLLGNRNESGSELAARILAAIRAWQPAATPQQDDITLVVIDIV